jgi:hypothetical protein
VRGLTAGVGGIPEGLTVSQCNEFLINFDSGALILDATGCAAPLVPVFSRRPSAYACQGLSVRTHTVAMVIVYKRLDRHD